MRRLVLLLTAMALSLLVASGVALAVIKTGIDGPDNLLGTKGSDVLSGRGGTDWIEGRAGNDIISGGPGNDSNPAQSRASGMLDGGPGADVISGGRGHDTLKGGPLVDSAVDILEGGDGDDMLHANNRPAARDIVSCGAGIDEAGVDRKDIVSDDCEMIYRGGIDHSVG
jgi:Ca2+-binding RTX toxin-like protein